MIYFNDFESVKLKHKLNYFFCSMNECGSFSKDGVEFSIVDSLDIVTSKLKLVQWLRDRQTQLFLSLQFKKIIKANALSLLTMFHCGNNFRVCIEFIFDSNYSKVC